MSVTYMSELQLWLLLACKKGNKISDCWINKNGADEKEYFEYNNLNGSVHNKIHFALYYNLTRHKVCVKLFLLFSKNILVPQIHIIF